MSLMLRCGSSSRHDSRCGVVSMTTRSRLQTVHGRWCTIRCVLASRALPRRRVAMRARSPAGGGDYLPSWSSERHRSLAKAVRRHEPVSEESDGCVVTPDIRYL